MFLAPFQGLGLLQVVSQLGPGVLALKPQHRGIATLRPLDQQFRNDQQLLQLQLEELRAKGDVAQSASERAGYAREALALERDMRLADIDEAVRKKSLTKEEADARKKIIEGLYGAAGAIVVQNQESEYQRQITREAEAALNRQKLDAIRDEADAPYRMLPTDLEKLYVRNNAGEMVPFSSFATGHWTSGSPQLNRFNSFPSINFWGEPAPGRSSGEAMQAMQEAVEKLPKGFGYDWTGLSYQESVSSSQAPFLYAFSIFVIFLCLAALYESWTVPASFTSERYWPSAAGAGSTRTTFPGFDVVKYRAVPTAMVEVTCWPERRATSEARAGSPDSR